MDFRAGSWHSAGMKVELTPDAAQWVEAEVAAGRFATAEDAVRYAIKRAELREMLDASEAEGGEHGSENVRQYVRNQLDRPAAPKTP